MNRLTAVSMIALWLAAGASLAQPAPRNPAAHVGREDALDPSPVDHAVNPDIGLFLNHWSNAKPRRQFGKLVFHDILTRLDGADPVHPKRRGAVLTAITAVSYATLGPGATVTGRLPDGERQSFYAVSGGGRITVNNKSYTVKDGVGFTLTPGMNFKLSNPGGAPLAFYVRSDPAPANGPASADLLVVNRFDFDRKVGAHWVHTCNAGPSGMLLCTIPPHTMPQPHSHPGEEAWIMVRGESVLSLGKALVRMRPGQAYKIPPTGVTAHSNLNMTDEPIEMIYMGPVDRSADSAAIAARAKATGPANLADMDYARLDNRPIDPGREPDIDMYMGNWRDAFPRMEHGNLYFRDMLTALQGADALHPARKGAVLINAKAVSYAMLEPGSSAHRLPGEPIDAQEVYVVNSGTGEIAAGADRISLSKGKAFILPPGLDFTLTATGARYLTFYVVTETLPPGAAQPQALKVVDNNNRPRAVADWFNDQRPVITKADGLVQFSTVNDVELKPMSMSRAKSDGPDGEEIWIATEGDIDMLFGKQLRKLPAGTAYRAPSTGITAHANINLTGTPAHFISVVK